VLENGNSFEVQCAYEFVFALHLYTTLEASHYFILRFDATSFGERNENKTI